MLISDLLSPERIRFDVKSSSKKRLLELISEELARNSDEFTKREIFESICARERLGSTGLGKGVAIPHGRIKGSQHVEASFIRLKKPLPFDAVDGQPVDLLFCLAVPEDCGEDHLKLLAQGAELFSDSELLQKLRQAEDAGTLMQLLSGARH
jgi:PTS system nitrogen regulatory IIA component